MVIQNSDVAISKAILIPASIIIGTGAAYMGYQIYLSSKRSKILNLQVSILTQKLIRLETEVSQIRADLDPLASSDDEFVDAFDAPEVSPPTKNSSSLLTKTVELSTSSENINAGTKGLEERLTKLDDKIEQGGLKNLTMAYDHLSQLSRILPHDYAVLWRLSQAAFLLATEEALENPNASIERQRELKLRAKAAADNALTCNSNCADAHKWMAIVLGSVTKELPAKSQLENAYKIRDHIDAAIKGKPHDSTIYYVKGRWCYSVYMLTWLERKLAATLFATPPTATLEETTLCFEKAEELKPLSSIDNLLFLGKVYIAGKKYQKAVNYLTAGEKMKCSSTDDFKSLEEIRQLLKQYRKYGA